MSNKTFILQATAADRPGLVAAAARCLAEAGANIVDLAQHSVTEQALFLLWARVDAPLSQDELTQRLQAAGAPLGLVFQVFDASRKPRVAILASRTAHCLYELLLKHVDGHLHCDIVGVAANHPDLEPVAGHFGVPFSHVPHEGDQARHEARLQAQLKTWDAELLVLARYMRVLSADFIRQWPDKALNIHHGFLPAFQGAKPYHQAWSKGVKLVGATAHFATADLDQGPILAQDTLHVSDRCSVEEMTELGKDVERKVLVDALKLLLEHRVFVHQGRTFILD
jgi:formyltetrahydrofolate deformylase